MCDRLDWIPESEWPYIFIRKGDIVEWKPIHNLVKIQFLTWLPRKNRSGKFNQVQFIGKRTRISLHPIMGFIHLLKNILAR